MALEELIDDLGGFGKFQLMFLCCVSSLKFVLGWSMMQMSFAGIIPDYICMTGSQPVQLETSNVSGSLWANQSEFYNLSINVCSVNGTGCKIYNFKGSQRTVITEWDLVCDRKWVKATVTSIQMGGVLLGAMLAGQSGDYFGRKKTLYGAFLALAVSNLIAAFSVSWEMFAVLRFFIGFFIGNVLVVIIPYATEFLPLKWRAVVPVIPYWAIGVSFFALAAYLMEDWVDLHLAIAVIGLPGLLGFFFFPESLRWLTVQGRQKEAYDVIEKIAALNGRPVPSYAKQLVEQISKEEEESRPDGSRYSYFDIFRGRRTVLITLSFGFHWLSFSAIFYGLSFGVSNFAGNVYLNIFLLNSLDFPFYIITFWLCNRFGRRRISFLYLFTGCVASFACLAVRMLAAENGRDTIISGLSYTAKIASSMAWVSGQIWIMEVYPTVTRSLGYGFANTAARVGGIIAPFAINLDDMVVFSYVLMGTLLLISTLLVFLIPETNGKALADNIQEFENNVKVEADQVQRDEKVEMEN